MQAKVAIIGGSGGYRFIQRSKEDILDSRQIQTPFGKSAPLHFIRLKSGHEYVFMSRHGEDGYRLTASFVNYRANICALKAAGVERIIAWSGPGAINPAYKPGDYVIPNDLIDMTKSRPQTFFENQGLGFIRQYPVFCRETTQVIAETLEGNGLPFHHGGTYVCTEGPRLETPAEVRFFKTIGADMVGMTLAPEVFLARELEMCYGSIGYITNYAEGTKPMDYQAGVLFEGTLDSAEQPRVDVAINKLYQLMPLIVDRLMPVKRQCPCKDSMLRYKKQKDIGPDWRKWISETKLKPR